MNDSPKLLIIGNNSPLPFSLPTFELLFASDKKDVFVKLRRFEPEVVLLFLDGFASEIEQGFAILNEIQVQVPRLKIIVLSERFEHQWAVKSISLGAWDYLEIPFDTTVLEQVIKRAMRISELVKAAQELHEETELPHGIIMNSAPMQKIWKTIQKIAPSNISILLQGPSGTGKEILARAVHDNSERANGPFIAINCAAIPETLLESELFGFEKGAFTGAHKLTIGRIEKAHQGTLFLDEIGDLPLSLQPKLLRFLQERVIERLGGATPLSLNVRIICATHQHLPQLIEKQAFREDLFYRLSEVAITLPPLRERGSDALMMARAFLAKYTAEFKRPVKKISEEALQAIYDYHWPGNVRELENRIKRAVVLSDGHHITTEDLDLSVEKEIHLPFNLKQARDKVERESILNAIRFCEGNISKAAELLGISRPTLYNMMEKLNILEPV